MMKIKGVIVFPSQIESALMQVPGMSDNYQIVKTKQGDIYSLSVEIEPSENRYKEGPLDDFEKKAESEIYRIGRASSRPASKRARRISYRPTRR